MSASLSVNAENGTRVAIPDMGLLFSGSELSARNAEMLYGSAQMLHASWSEQVLAGNLDAMRQDLPPICDSVDEVFCSRFARCFSDLGRRLENGQLPAAQNTGEELAIFMLLSHMDVRIEIAGSVRDALTFSELAEVLPEDASDGDTQLLSELLVDSDDVLCLYDVAAVEKGKLDALGAFLSSIGTRNLLPQQWFLPFAV